jgi:all-trans-8'-apo-beta-carotenal 15,15'-oxygenase
VTDHALHTQVEPSREYDLDLTVTAGTWPAGLWGHAFIIGPAQPTVVNFCWAGFGIVTRVDLTPNTSGVPHWTSRNVRTPDSDLMAAALGAVPAADLPGLLAGAQPAFTNTAPHFLGDRLLLTYDRQRPAEFDPQTLEFRSYIGAVADYPVVSPHPLFPGVLTTGHPVEDCEEQCMWWCNIGLEPLGRSRTDRQGPLHVVRWDGHGPIETWSVPSATITQGIHEIAVTKDYVIFTEVGNQDEPGTFAGRGRTKPHPPYSDIFIVAKKDLTPERRGKAVPCAHARLPFESFHEFADYRQDGDDITLYIAHSNGWDLNIALGENDRTWHGGRPIAPGLHGFLPLPVDASPVGRYVIDGRTGEVKDSKLFVDPGKHWATLLYGRDMRRPALERGRYLWQAYWGYNPEMLVPQAVELHRHHPYRIVPIEELPAQAFPSTVACIDLETMQEQSSWAFPAGSFAQSPVFVPDRAGGDGWMLVFVQFTDHTELQVFDALALGKGPVAVATAPGLKQSFQVHSGWMPRLAPQPVDYPRSSLRADLGSGLNDLPAPLRAAVEPVVQRWS